MLFHAVPHCATTTWCNLSTLKIGFDAIPTRARCDDTPQFQPLRCSSCCYFLFKGDPSGIAVLLLLPLAYWNKGIMEPKSRRTTRSPSGMSEARGKKASVQSTAYVERGAPGSPPSQCALRSSAAESRRKLRAAM